MLAAFLSDISGMCRYPDLVTKTPHVKELRAAIMCHSNADTDLVPKFVLTKDTISSIGSVMVLKLQQLPQTLSKSPNPLLLSSYAVLVILPTLLHSCVGKVVFGCKVGFYAAKQNLLNTAVQKYFGVCITR
jgi:hypothetical protein